MPVTPPNLTALDTATVQTNLATVTQLVGEANTDLDLRRGVIHDIVLYLHAALTTRDQATLARYLSAQSLLDISNNPTLADTDIVAKVLSNWGVTPNAGVAAKGEVTLVVASSNSVTIGTGAVFTANGNTYTADMAFTAKAEAAQINNVSDRLMTRLSDGNWSFTVTVTSTVVGSAGIIAKNTLVVPAAPPYNYVTSYATNDFTGGLDAQTTNELMQLLQEGLATKAPSNRINMQAMLRERFPTILRSSIIGHGDEEMIRDQHTIWPGSLGGRADWYVRTQERVNQLTLTPTCTLISKDGAIGIWQLTIGRDDAPGFYEVVSVLPIAAANVLGTLSVVADVRGLDLSGTGFVPDILTATEGVYSRFQTAIVQFQDNVTDQSALAIGDTAQYQVTVRIMPMIAQLQSYMSGFDTRSYGADVLLKAPVPCFMKLNFTISKNQTQADPDVAAIKTALAKTVNNLDFVGRIAASQLQNVVQGYLAEGMTAGQMDMFGRLRWPDGTTHYVRNAELLQISGTAGSMVSSRTVSMFLLPEDIGITVTAEIPLPQ